MTEWMHMVGKGYVVDSSLDVNNMLNMKSNFINRLYD